MTAPTGNTAPLDHVLPDDPPSRVIVRIPGTPAKALTPNGRAHHMVKHRANKAAISDAYYAALNANVEMWEPSPPSPPLTLNYLVAWEKGHKRMDDDNLKASLKSYQDGLALALGVNDKHMIVGTVQQDRDPAGAGYIEVAIEEGQAA